MYKNIKYKNKKGLSESLRGRGPIKDYLPLRHPGTLDTRRIFVIGNIDGTCRDYASFVFSSYQAASKFLQKIDQEDSIDCIIRPLFTVLVGTRS